VAGAAAAALVVALTADWIAAAQAPAPSRGVTFARITETDTKEWLTYLSSDLLQGREAFSEGYGLAASYVARQLEALRLKPVGDAGTYFQTVHQHAYRVVRNSIVTVRANGQERTFKHGDHVTFAVNSGGPQTLVFDGVEFAGYGLVTRRGDLSYDDFASRDVKGKLVVWLPGTPEVVRADGAGRGRGATGGNRAAYMTQSLGVAAAIGFAPAVVPTAAEAALAKAQAALAEASQAVRSAEVEVRGRGRGGRTGGGGGARGAAVPADLTTTQRVDKAVPPQLTADEEFHRFLFSGSQTSFEDLRAKADRGEPLAPFTLANVRVTIQIDNTYDLLSTQLTKNVVGMVEGTDPKLRNTYVFFGAHLDHEGYRTAPVGRGGRGGVAEAAGAPDLIFNGADDDGSGSSALIGIAKAFASGPRAKRSAVFVWHAAEEPGLLGSRYMADFPVVPLDAVQAQFNLDMIGRNRNDDPSQSETVFVVGADRISTDLHNLLVETNRSLDAPLRLDFEYNDPADANSFYTRSDHYSYAVKGIPVAFFFTGTHPDYHGVGDHVDKIVFPKLVRIAQLVYQTGFNLANSDRTLARDQKGPRAGRGFDGRLE
jgi:hypothetical protein